MSQRRALCIGIDDYPGPESLNGAVADARDWRAMLEDVFGFQAGDLSLLTNKTATRARILSGFETLLSGLADGDAAVFTFSGHGSYITGAAPAGSQPVICPYDMERAWIELSDLARMTDALTKGVRLTVVLDAGFAGTVLRAAFAESLPGVRGSDDRRARFLSPALFGKRLSMNPWSVNEDAAGWNATVYTACGRQQYAEEAFVDGAHRGVFSYAAVRTLRAAQGKLTPKQLLVATTTWLRGHGFNQTPAVVGRQAKTRRSAFI